jgi:hypothetical protein
MTEPLHATSGRLSDDGLFGGDNAGKLNSPYRLRYLQRRPSAWVDIVVNCEQ